MARRTRGFDTDAAWSHLTKRDRKLGTWMEKLGPIEADPRWRKPFDPVDALARAILYQQLSGKAAATIVGRVEAAIASDRFHCDTLARIDDAALRACGVSGNKSLALRDLALREERGEIPDAAADGDDGRRRDHRRARADPRHRPLDGRDDADVPPRPARRAAGRRPRHPQGRAGASTSSTRCPRRRCCSARGEKWGPYRTYASLYLWRIADLANAPKAKDAKPVKRSQG